MDITNQEIQHVDQAPFFLSKEMLDNNILTQFRGDMRILEAQKKLKIKITATKVFFTINNAIYNLQGGIGPNKPPLFKIKFGFKHLV